MRVPGERVSHREPRVAVLTTRPLAHDCALDPELRMQRRTHRLPHAVRRPQTPAGGEVRSRRGMPVLGVDDRGTRGRGPSDLVVDGGDDAFAAGHIQTPPGRGEVVLDVDHQESDARSVSLGHSPILGRCLHRRTTGARTAVCSASVVCARYPGAHGFLICRDPVLSPGRIKVGGCAAETMGLTCWRRTDVPGPRPHPPWRPNGIWLSRTRRPVSAERWSRSRRAVWSWRTVTAGAVPFRSPKERFCWMAGR